MTSEKIIKTPLVSVVTVNYNHSDDTIAVLDSLNKITYKNLEIIVVDNGSELEDYEKLKKYCKGMDIIRIVDNVGFAGANNRGIIKSKGDFILSINNDIIVPEDFLDPLIKKLQDNPDYGVVCPKIYFYEPPQNIQFAGYTMFNELTVRNRGIGYNEPDTGQYEVDTITAFAHGAAMLFTRKVLNEVGLMSEYFFLYYEELDWGKRVRDAGYKIGYVHNSYVYHKASATNGQNSPLTTYYNNRGRLIYMRRNIKFPKILLSTLYLYLIALPKNMFGFISKGEFKNAKAFLRAYGWYLYHMFDKNIKVNPQVK